MSGQELKTQLEKALHTRITAAEWEALEELGIISSYMANDFAYADWADFKRDVERNLNRLRRFLQNTQREQSGEPLLETETPEPLPEPADVLSISAPLSERTAARAGALSALDRLRSGPPWERVSREISSRVRPRGGFDNRLPQWVIELEIEAWVPADDVRNIYQQVQRDLLAEEAGPKVQPRTFRVAQFVWEETLRSGKRPSWRVLLERWSELNPDDRIFCDWRAFRTCFKRGEEATPPRYTQGNDYIANAARRLRRLREAWEEGPRFGLRPDSIKQRH